MNIAINTRFLLPNKMEGFGWYTYEISKRLVSNYPEHTFYFFFDRPFDEKFVFAKNVIPIVLSPPARHPILFYIWFEFSVRKALKKYNIDLFFSPDGYLSLKTNVPQVGVIHDINFEHFPKDLPPFASKYLRYFFPKFAKKAKKIITVSEYSKKDIVEKYAISPSKISAIWNGASEKYKVLDHQNQNNVREKYTKGKNYFLFVGSLHPRKNIKRLLEAYQIYQKKHPNGLDLVIVGNVLWKSAQSEISLPNYLEKHIHFVGHLQLEELVQITASATCLTYVPYFEGFGIPLVEAMKCGVPIICGNLSSLPEVVGDAAILVDPFSVEEIADAMEKCYLDENLRKTLSEKSLERGKLFSWDKASKTVGEVLFKSAIN